MPEYSVRFTETYVRTWHVEAESSEAAVVLAKAAAVARVTRSYSHLGELVRVSLVEPEPEVELLEKPGGES